MYDETKFAVRKAIEVCRILYSMGPKKYNELLSLTAKIQPPTIKEIEIYLEKGIDYEDAVIEILKEKYKQVAVSHSYTEEQGVAMLEYAALLGELDDEV